MQWLKARDANTKFFQLKASARRSKNFITRLEDGPAVYSDHASMTTLLFNFFKNQLGTEVSSDTSLDLPYLFANENIDLHSLQDSFIEEEVRRVVFSYAPEKAPGLESFPLLFYQRFWRVIKNDLMEVFHNLHRERLNLDSVNRGWICLIPKKTEAAEVRDFRPICLVNGLSKIISKVLATRLQRVLEMLINPYQTAFIKGCSILDNFFTAHILTHHLQSFKQRAALFKIDFERAFDHLNWHFLVDLLQSRGFNSIWVNWIKTLPFSSSTAMLLNGTLRAFFQCKRGLRQGDPLSPLLFILCIDALFRMFQQASSYSLLPLVGAGGVNIHTLQFADDLLLFFDGTRDRQRLLRWSSKPSRRPPD